MAATTESKKMITLRSSDGEEFEIVENVAKESQTIKHMIEDDCAESVIPLPNVNSKSKVIEYSKKHVDSSSSMSDEKTADQELKAWDAEFVKVDHATLFDMTPSSKSRKRKRGSKDSGSKSSVGLSGKRSRMESIKSKDTPKAKEKSADEEEEDDENGVPVEDDEPGNSESKEKEFESEKEAEDDKERDPEEKPSGKNVDKGEGKSKESGEYGPSMEDLKLFICNFLRIVNLDTVTFARMFAVLRGTFRIDLTPRKAAIKLLVEQEIAMREDLIMKCDYYDEFISDDE